MSTLFPTSHTSLFHRDHAIRAHRRAERAADAGFLIGDSRGIVTLFVDRILGHFQDFLGTGLDAKTAAFAKFFFKSKFCQNRCTSVC